MLYIILLTLMQNVSSNSFATVRRAFYSRAANNDDIPLQMCTVWGRGERGGGRRKAALVMTAYKFQMQMLSQGSGKFTRADRTAICQCYMLHTLRRLHMAISVAQLGCGSTSLGASSSSPYPLPHFIIFSVLLPLAVVRQSRLHYANNLSQLSCATCCKFHKFQFRLSR